MRQKGPRGPGAPARRPSRTAGADREVLVGLHPVREALRAGRRRLLRLHVRRGERGLRPELAELAEAARACEVPVEELAPPDFELLVPPGVPHQGVVLEAGPLPDLDASDLVPADPDAGAWLLALDGIEDPQNVGALLRVADAAGVRGVLLPERRAAPLTPAVARASAGALEHLPIARVTNLPRALEQLKREGFWVHGADPDAELDLFQAPERWFDRRLVLVLGAEGRGVRPGVRAVVDVAFRIPMGGAVASLNVATAAAVFLFEWRRRAAASARSAAEIPR